MQPASNKQEKEQIVIKLYHEGGTIRDIAHAAYMSFTDIGRIIQKVDGLKEENMDFKNKSKQAQGLHLFSISY